MRFIKSLLSFGRLNRLLTSFSVRTRIIVLALIPVVGFLANGLTYVSGEGGYLLLDDRDISGFGIANTPGKFHDAPCCAGSALPWPYQCWK